MKLIEIIDWKTRSDSEENLNPTCDESLFFILMKQPKQNGQFQDHYSQKHTTHHRGQSFQAKSSPWKPRARLEWKWVKYTANVQRKIWKTFRKPGKLLFNTTLKKMTRKKQV